MIMTMDQFKGKTALVTGASSGIGYKLSIALAELGTKVIAVGRSLDRLEELKNTQSDIEIHSVNLANWQETRIKLAELCKNVDFLVNNAGLGAVFPLEEIDEQKVDKVLDINLKSAMNLIQLVAEGMKARRSGAIVNVSSVAGISALDWHMAYGASKAGLDMVTKIAAKELGPYNIRVNSVNPTAVFTPMSVEYWSEPTRNKQMISKIPMDRFAEIDEVVKPIIFLLSDGASMINGVMLPIDGGFVAT